MFAHWNLLFNFEIGLLSRFHSIGGGKTQTVTGTHFHMVLLTDNQSGCNCEHPYSFTSFACLTRCGQFPHPNGATRFCDVNFTERDGKGWWRAVAYTYCIVGIPQTYHEFAKVETYSIHCAGQFSSDFFQFVRRLQHFQQRVYDSTCDPTSFRWSSRERMNGKILQRVFDKTDTDKRWSHLPKALGTSPAARVRGINVHDKIP